MDALQHLCEIKDSFNSNTSKKTRNSRNNRNVYLPIPVKYVFNRNNTATSVSTSISPISPRTLRQEIFYLNDNNTNNNNLNANNTDIKLILTENININGKFPQSTYVWADLDLSFNFMSQTYGYIIQQNLKHSTFLIADSDPGVAAYVEYRCPYPYSQIFFRDSINKIYQIYPEGLQFIFNNTPDYNLDYIKYCKLNGMFIYKINEIDLNKLFVCALSFKSICLFKPFLSGSSYVICENYLGSTDYLTDFEKTNDKSSKINIPGDFKLYIENFTKNISFNSGNYNLYKCKALMNII